MAARAKLTRIRLFRGARTYASELLNSSIPMYRSKRAMILNTLQEQCPNVF